MILLLTGCINPAGMSYTTLINPEERKKQYVDAIHFYLSKTNYPIVFSENSEEKVTENVKLLSMPFKTPN